MSSRWLSLSLGAVFTLSLASAACDRPSDITSANNSAVAPQMSASGKDLKPLRVTVTASGSYVCESGQQGNVCVFEGGSLYIPAKTVPAHTRFTIDLSVGPNVTASLTASSSACWWSETTGGGPCSNDVGAAGFKNPVKLTLSTFGASANGVVVAWKTSDSHLIGQPTVDNGDGTVTGDLSHFSEYILAEK